MKHTQDKKKGTEPQYDHSKIRELLDAGKKPAAIMILLGCSYGVVRYVRTQRKKKRLVK
jgi:hypothetical protein